MKRIKLLKSFVGHKIDPKTKVPIPFGFAEGATILWPSDEADKFVMLGIAEYAPEKK